MTTCTRITSPTNTFVKFLNSLHDRKGREEWGKFLAEGTRICGSLLASPLKCEKLIVTDALFAQAQEMVPHEIIVLVSDEVMRKVSSATTPSGMVGLFEIPEQLSLDKLSSGLVLTHIMDPGNMGTLVRTAVAFNYASLILVGGVDPWNAKTVQASAGTLGNIALFHLSWDEFVAHARNRHCELSALVVRGGEDPRKFSYQKDHFFIIGGEAQGIPQAWIDQCNRKLTLPMPGAAESLNAAIAGSLTLALAYWQMHPIA
jgi:TrmH family RNA methyltransferase